MRLLIIGTLNGQIGAASQIAIKRGAKVQQADTIDLGLEALRAGKGSDVVMIDVKLDVADLVTRLEAERISLPVVACGVESDTRSAVRAIRAGAKEYVPLPPDADMIAAVLEAVADDSHTLVFADPAMEKSLLLAEQVAPSDASVMITGESGTGKEIVARFIHRQSKRKDGPFIAVNCAAIPENLMESELFGHEKGAFTGAVARRLGKFEEANSGTLLLDEISEMDPRLQAKLLRAIQEREIDRIGAKKPVKIDVRILATSNRDLEKEVAAGNFRQDLFFRLNVVPVDLPSLRARPKDISVLAKHFAAKYAEANGMVNRPITANADRKLNEYAWPGNVRELENIMHRAVLIATGDELDDGAIMLQGSEASASAGSGVADAGAQGLVGKTVAQVEQDLILDTLNHCLGNRTHAANILGISIRTLRNKLKQYNDDGVVVPQPGDNGQPAA